MLTLKHITQKIQLLLTLALILSESFRIYLKPLLLIMLQTLPTSLTMRARIWTIKLNPLSHSISESKVHFGCGLLQAQLHFGSSQESSICNTGQKPKTGDIKDPHHSIILMIKTQTIWCICKPSNHQATENFTMLVSQMLHSSILQMALRSTRNGQVSISQGYQFDHSININGIELIIRSLIEMQDNSLKNKYKINIQYCKSCDTHNWCTHHDEQRYQQVYRELAQAIAKQFPGLPVVGNQLPPTLVPIKAKENKYYDCQDKKYVIFPSIGAFQVYLNKELIFSKKAHNTWPINAEILNQIHMKIKGVPRRADTEESSKCQKYEISQKQQKETVKMADDILSNLDRNSTFYRDKTKKQLTLTDHFKKYKMKKKSQDDLLSLYAESQAPSASTISPITAEDIRKLHHIWGKKENLPNFIKDKAFIQLRQGKKEMLVNLSSIEEENELKQNFMAPKQKKNKISNLQVQFQKLQNKLRKFECRVSQVNSKKFGLEYLNPVQQEKQKRRNKISFIQKIQQVKTAYNAQKYVKLIKDKKKRMIEEYIHATSEEKNEKLEQIYGPQYMKPNIRFSKKISKKSQVNVNKNSFTENQTENQSENSSSYEQDEEQSNTDLLKSPQKRQTTNPKNLFNFTQGRSQSKNKPKDPSNKLTTDTSIQVHRFLSPFQKQKRQFQSRSLMHKPGRQKTQINSNENNRKTESEDVKFGGNPIQFKFGLSRAKNEPKNQIKQKNQSVHKISHLLKASKSALNFNKYRNKNQSQKSQKNQKSQKSQQITVHPIRKEDNINQVQQNQQTRRNFSQSSKRSNFSKSSQSNKRKDKQLTLQILAKNQGKVIQLKKSRRKQNSEQLKAKFEQKSSQIQFLKQNNKKQRKTQKKTSERVNHKQKQSNQVRSSFYQSSPSNKSKKQKVNRKKQRSPKIKQRQSQQQFNNQNRYSNEHASRILEDKEVHCSEESYQNSQKSQFLENSQNYKEQLSYVEKNQLSPERKQQKINKNINTDQSESELIQLENVINTSELVHKQDLALTGNQTSEQKNSQIQRVAENKIHRKQDSEPFLKVIQQNNVGVESRPRRIFEIDEERPEMVDVAVQKNSRIPVRQKASQTLHENQESFQHNSEQDTEPLQTKQVKKKNNGAESDSPKKESNKQGKKQVITTGKYKQDEILFQEKKQTPHEMNQQIKKHDSIKGFQKQDKQWEQNQQLFVQKHLQNVCEQEVNPKNIQKLEKKHLQTNQKEQPEVPKRQQIQNKQVTENKVVDDFKSEKFLSQEIPQPQLKITKQKASIIKQFYGSQYQSKLMSQTTIKAPSIQHETRQTIQIKNLYQKKGQIFEKDAIDFAKILVKDERLSKFSKIIKILCERNEFLIIRLFQDPEFRSADSFKIWLCNNYTWNCYEVTQAVVDSNLQPLFVHHLGFQIWPIILVEALIIMFEGFQKLCQASVPELFHALTGSSYLNFKVKEDPQKNSRLLKFISQNEKKNFIIRAQKRMHYSLGQSIEQRKQSSSFFILSQKTVNDNQILLRMKKTNSEAFWIKLQKFVGQFSQVDVLQLRVNHNFSSISLNDCNPGHFKIVQFIFSEECFGSVVAVTEAKLTDFKMYLYKEEQDSVLRLVGQASDKNKKMTFFDCCFEEGKYLLFTDIKWASNKICYMGQGRPRMNIKQEVKQSGLKSDYTEYIPISTMPQKKQPQMPTFLNMTRKSQKSSILNIESGAKYKKSGKEYLDMHKIRQEFVDFLANNS